ncbi:hypothetical protein [Aestuariivita sp.]|jgi:predicted regulator of Ras-like GTPase activity (Roadblock/LC7/MglB family)|uniref:hypothetical protein n=1 Tax=Aestuariivita sp. TaxID=1872407 RepID=UPI00216FAF30|nr:hypothetical protein [Aestuariivita sp.]MCE8008192.1 hypothetical protein [Aestuariivita sp.]
MKLTLTTAIAAALMATGAMASDTAPTDTSSETEVLVDVRDAGALTAVEVATLNEAGYLIDENEAYLVDAKGDWIKVDLSKRYAGADPTAAQGIDDEGLIMASRGADNASAEEVFNVDSAGFVSDADGFFIVGIDGLPIRAELSERSAGSDDTATMGVDDEGDITASRGTDNETAAEAATD